MAKYIGITLGPIGDTMSLSSSPAGLWAASYLFSYLAHEIRINIGKDGLVRDSYNFRDGHTVGELFDKGVGLYHDRIIYEADAEHDLDNAVCAVKQSVDKIIKGFLASIRFAEEKEYLEEFFNEYFNIHIVNLDIGDDENFLLRVNDALDAAELEKSFPSRIKYNPILKLFDGNEKGRNEEIKASFLVSGTDDNRAYSWVLTDNTERGIKDLPSIAAVTGTNTYADKEKAAKYYAVIRADGDNMGSTVKKIASEADYIGFSEKCFKYGCKTAEIVLKYGGIPIYVGGDDLLCIVPLMCNDGDKKHTFLEMITEIRAAFKEEFTDGPDLSFGVQIQYVKAPLYEGLNESGRLLFATAKANKPGAVAVNLKKHSGQSAEILIKDIGGIGKEIIARLNELILKHASEETLKSVGTHIADFSALFNQAGEIGNTALSRFFDNMFDNGMSKDDLQYIKLIDVLAEKINDVREKSAKNTSEDTLSKVLEAYIRLIKFFSEKADREEDGR